MLVFRQTTFKYVRTFVTTCGRPSQDIECPSEGNSKTQTSKGKQSHFEPVIGLEVHARLDLKSKLFSQGANSSTTTPNKQLDFFDVALPGTLPKLNRDALKLAISAALALNCQVQDSINFDRKNYFYPDMPAGYQITQYNKPMARQGHLEFIVRAHHKSTIAHSQHYDLIKYLYADEQQKDEISPYLKKSNIKQIQLEQDSAKALHPEGQVSDNYMIDYNRSGTALIEIVFEPDLSSHHEASSLVKELAATLRNFEVCQCEMQDGSLRVDANVSILEKSENKSHPRVELKNLNSLKALDKAIAFEINRQTELLRDGQDVRQESRIYDSKQGRTVILREKEKAADYRYIPEPSIPPLFIDDNIMGDIKQMLTDKQLPSQLRNKLLKKFDLDLTLVAELIERPALINFMLETLADISSGEANLIADFLIYSVSELERSAKSVGQDTNSNQIFEIIGKERLREVLLMILSDDISFATAHEILKLYFANQLDHRSPREIVVQMNMLQIKNEDQIGEMCDRVIEGMKNISSKYRKKGEKKQMRLLLSKLLELNGNQVSVKVAMSILNKKLRPQ